MTGVSTRHAAVRHSSAGVRIFKKDSTPIPLPIADQTRGHNQGAIEHFVRCFARAAPLLHLAACAPPDATRLETAPPGCLAPYSHSIINSFGKSLSGLMLISRRRVSYRQKYRHSDWDPRAQLPPSIDIYREPSALSQSLAFEIYRDLSLRCMRSRRWKQPLGHSSRERQGSAIKWHNVLSHRVFVAILLPSRRRRMGAAISARPPSLPLPLSTA